MAEEQEDRSTDDLSDEASPQRLEDYRKKGMVAQSREVSALVAIMGAAAATYVFAPQMVGQLAEFMREVFNADLAARMNFGSNSVVGTALLKALKVAIAIGLPICIAGFILGIIGSVAQIGAVFTFEPLSPDINKIDPIAGFKRLFSMRHLIDSLRTVAKMIIVVTVAYFVAKPEILNSPRYLVSDPSSLFGAYAHSAEIMFLALFGTLAVFAALDFFHQRWEFGKKVRLTKQEAKEEHKEREGDPQIKARIRAVQREMARRRMMEAVKKADVVVTNPTHIAVALQYSKDSMFAPKVVAKGADFVAQKIKKLAADAGVPMVENVPLARTLYKSVKIGQYVPRALYQAIAEVLAYVYRLKNRKF